MAQNSARAVGRHFLQIPGPTTVPDRVMRAIDNPLIDHRGPEFAKLTKRCLEGIKSIFKTTNPVIVYTATGTGAWEASLTNLISPGDKILCSIKTSVLKCAHVAVSLTILGSGSGGNCAYLETPEVRLLIDAGFSGRQIRQRLGSIGRAPENLSAILITHEHGDHVENLAKLKDLTGAQVMVGEGDVLGDHLGLAGHQQDVIEGECLLH